jgi:hypothetical protein
MRCRINKWLISRSLDREKSFPRQVRRHIESCATCREFARFSQSLAEKAQRDADVLFEKSPTFRPEDIIAKAEFFPTPEEAAWPKRRLFWIPVVSTAAVGLIVAAVIFLHPWAPAGPASFWEQIDTLKKIHLSGRSIEGLAVGAESPLETEYESLKKAVESATKFLLDRLDIGIGAKTS